MLMRNVILALGIILLLALPAPASAVPTGAQMMMTTSAKSSQGGPPPPTPVSITFATNPLSISDSTASSVAVDSFTVNMSDGGTYHGTPTGACATQSPCPLTICGSTGSWQICTAAALNSSYDISNANFTVTAN